MLQELKVLIGISKDEQELDAKLEWILSSVRSRLKFLLGGIEPPDDMKHIIVEVAVIRYNRIGSEGMSINNVEGENQHYHDSDFKGFMGEIQAYLDTINTVAKKGGFRFL